LGASVLSLALGASVSSFVLVFSSSSLVFSLASGLSSWDFAAYTEGFTTPDLVDAAALLRALE
jgi:hypothetical protein